MRESISVQNLGWGPAFIEKISVEVNGEIYETDPYGYLLETDAIEDISTINRLFPGRIIPANTEIELYEKETDSTSNVILSNTFKFSLDISNMPSYNENKAIIKIIYRNVYDDKWKISSNHTIPVEVD